MKHSVVVWLLPYFAVSNGPSLVRCFSPATIQKTRFSLTSLTASTNDFGEPTEEEKAGGSLVDSESDGISETKPARREIEIAPMTTRQMMAAVGTSPRRIVLSLLSASGIALAGNFLGVTSNVLTMIPEDTVESIGLDTYYPRGDFKRYKGKGYTFVIPKEWVADTFLELAKAQQQAKPLTVYEMKRKKRDNVLPDAAYGPPGQLNRRGVSKQGDTNVSVIVSSVLPGFSLKGTLGDPTNAAEFLLSVSLAPEGSGKVATLIDANEDAGRAVYQFEYKIDRGSMGPPLRAISVIAAQTGDKLVTLTVVAPEKDWANMDFAAKLRRVAESFHLV